MIAVRKQERTNESKTMARTSDKPALKLHHGSKGEAPDFTSRSLQAQVSAVVAGRAHDHCMMYMEQLGATDEPDCSLYRLCRQVVENHHGRLVQGAGGVVAVFEQTLDAVRAALFIKRNVFEQRHILPAQFGSVHYRIGITAGEVKLHGRWLPTDDYQLIKKSMQMQSQARRNQILIDESVFALIGGLVHEGGDDFLIGSPNRVKLDGLGESTLYELSPGSMGLDIWQPEYESGFATFAGDWDI
ncbi:MAG: hypothetical protein R8K50_00805 [Mariprofundus sp.]